MGLYLHAKFQVSSVILTSFRQVGGGGWGGDRSEICTEVSFTSPERTRTLMMKLPYMEVKFYPEVKSQTGLSSLWVSCKLTLK